MRVVRVYHGGRDAAHRERDRALVRAGVELSLIVPTAWPGADDLAAEPFEVVQLPVHRPGDVNRHRFAHVGGLAELIARRGPDVVDLHEEPFSAVVHQLLNAVPVRQAVVTYAAQNIDKRFPPPFAQWERRALGRVRGIYPCSRQAASVVAGKGFTGAIKVLPLGVPSAVTAGDQSLPADELELLLVGRLVPEKGVLDAVRVLATVVGRHPARLTIVGEGPEKQRAVDLATRLGVAPYLTFEPWLGASALAERYRRAHVLLAPSRTTRTWVEQFGRMVVEAQAAGAVVVGYASGSLPEVVGRAGVLVTEGDEDALAGAMIELAENPRRWASLRDLGLAAAERCRWDAIAAGQIELYEQALAPSIVHPRPRPRRGVAVAEFGPPATVAGGGRPFAVPVLREDTGATRALARAVDAVVRRDQPSAPARLRVVYIDHVARLSGGELALARLIAALPEVEAHVILAEDGPLRPMLEEAGASVEILPMDEAARDLRRDEAAGAGGLRVALSTARYTLRLARRLRELQPDLVHTNSLKSGYYGSLAARLARRPVIWHLRDRIATDYLPAAAVRLTRIALQRLPDLVLCNSEETLRASGAASGYVTVVNSPVVHDPYEPAEVESRHPPATVIGIVGRLSPWKGQDVFLRAFADAFADRPDVRGRIVGSAMFGEDEWEQKLLVLADELGLADRITFVGFTEHVEQELAEMHVLVHASTVPEPFGQVIVEGMAAGLAVIATRAGGPVEIITDGVDGLLTEPGDVGELSAAMSRLVGDEALRGRLGDAATRRARDFSPARIGPVVDGLYRELLRQRGR